jgi:hypothetical protein
MVDTPISVSSVGILTCLFVSVGKVGNVAVPSTRNRGEPQLLKAMVLGSNTSHEIRTSMANEYK